MHDCVSPQTFPVAAPETPMFLDAWLADAPLLGGVSPRLGEHALKVVSIRGLPAVRPSEAVTDQPTSYDRLPEPRFIRATEGETDADGAAASAAAPPRASVRPRPRQEAVVRTDARALAVRSGLFFEDAAPAAEGRSDAERSAPGWNENRLQPPRSPYEVKAGTVLPALMLTAVDTARPGPVVGVVSQPVFDTVSGHHLLIPAGARLIGRHEGDGRHGEGRAYLIWDRIVLPNGKSLALEGEPGVDAIGAVGVEGRVRRRTGAMLFAALLGGAVTALGQAARDDDRGGWLGDAGDAAAIEAARRVVMSARARIIRANAFWNGPGARSGI